MVKSISFINTVKHLKQIKDIAELKELYGIVFERYKEFDRRDCSDLKLSLGLGDKVKIKAENLKGKADRLYGVIGIIVKLNPSKAIVEFNGVKWNIPYTMLIKE